jgi:hypothetical protein
MVQKGVLLELVLLAEHKIAPEHLMGLKNKLGTALKLLPLQQTLRIRMTENQKANVLFFLKAVILNLSGEEAELSKRKEKR